MRRPEGKGEAEVEIHLADTRIGGQVVDAAGRPQEKALVFLRPDGAEDGQVTARTDKSGSFEILGLPEGYATVAAEAVSGAESEVLDIEIREGRFGTPDFDLVVTERQVVRGRVLSENGPVPGAVIYFRQADTLLARGDQTSSDAQGYFDLELPADVSAAHVQVRAPGYGFYLARHPLASSDGSSGSVDIHLQKVWGAVDLHFNLDEYEWIFALHNGATAWYGPLRSWAQLHTEGGAVADGLLQLARLDVGNWSFCRVRPGSPSWTQVYAGQASRGCRTVRVAPGSLETVDLSG